MKFIYITLILAFTKSNAQDNYNLLIGTYTKECYSEGIYVYNFNTANGDFKLKANTSGVTNPSYLSVSPDKKYVYSVNENGDDSSITAFRYTSDNGKLKQLNKKDTKGNDPCYVINDDKNVICANYGMGTIDVFSKNADGSIDEITQTVKHQGGSINKSRQQSPHAHMVYFSPDKKYVFATDLGTDKIYLYSYNPNGGSKTLELKQTIDAKPGSGPRHLAFNPNGIFFYVLGEIDASLTAYSYINGRIEKIQQTTIASIESECENAAADIKLSRDGKFIYATNRGTSNTITVFKTHSNGKINFVQQVSTEGEEPRSIIVDPKDNFVLVANQKSNMVTIFKRDKTTGMLTGTAKKLEVCAPACLTFAENRQ